MLLCVDLQVYITNANKAVADMKSPPSLLELQKGAISAGPLARNGGGGAYNHDLFWAEMCAPKDSGAPSSALAAAIDKSFGSFDKMKEEFNTKLRVASALDGKARGKWQEGTKDCYNAKPR